MMPTLFCSSSYITDQCDNDLMMWTWIANGSMGMWEGKEETEHAASWYRVSCNEWMDCHLGWNANCRSRDPWIMQREDKRITLRQMEMESAYILFVSYVFSFVILIKCICHFIHVLNFKNRQRVCSVNFNSFYNFVGIYFPVIQHTVTVTVLNQV